MVIVGETVLVGDAVGVSIRGVPGRVGVLNVLHPVNRIHDSVHDNVKKNKYFFIQHPFKTSVRILPSCTLKSRSYAAGIPRFNPRATA